MPPSVQERSRYLESLVRTKADLALFCNQPLDVAGRTKPSDAKNFFDSKPFADWKKEREHKSKVDAAIIEHLAAVIDGLGAIARGRR